MIALSIILIIAMFIYGYMFNLSIDIFLISTSIIVILMIIYKIKYEKIDNMQKDIIKEVKNKNKFNFENKIGRIKNKDNIRILIKDKHFYKEEFETWSKEVFIKLQYVLALKNINLIKSFVIEEIYNLFNLKIKNLISKNQSNVLNDLNIISSDIIDYKVENEKEIIIVKIHCSMKNYIIDDFTEKVIIGNKKETLHKNYLLTFSRNEGTKTKLKHNMISCPNCSAPINLDVHRKCEYCGSIIEDRIKKWIITSIETI